MRGEQTIDGAHVYFEYGGKQVKGDFDYNKQFHDKDSGNLVTNRFVTVNDKTYFIGADSKAIKGATVIDNIEYFFDKETGAQVKGNFARNDKYYDGVTGALVTNSYVQVDKDWYYVAMTVKDLKVLKPLTMFLYTLILMGVDKPKVSLVTMATSTTKILVLKYI